jgi:hypothetical protein
MNYIRKHFLKICPFDFKATIYIISSGIDLTNYTIKLFDRTVIQTLELIEVTRP